FGQQSLVIFSREIKEAVIHFVEGNFRVATGVANKSLAGLSIGVLHTLYTRVRITDLFNYLGVISSEWKSNQFVVSYPDFAFMTDNAATINSNLKQFWIAMGGEEDIAYESCKIMMAKFDEMGIKYSYTEHPGGHTWPVWRHNLYSFAPLLFR